MSRAETPQSRGVRPHGAARRRGDPALESRALRAARGRPAFGLARVSRPQFSPSGGLSSPSCPCGATPAVAASGACSRMQSSSLRSEPPWNRAGMRTSGLTCQPDSDVTRRLTALRARGTSHVSIGVRVAAAALASTNKIYLLRSDGIQRHQGTRFAELDHGSRESRGRWGVPECPRGRPARAHAQGATSASTRLATSVVIHRSHAPRRRARARAQGDGKRWGKEAVATTAASP